MGGDNPIEGMRWRYIADPEQLREAVGGLSAEAILGLDTETFWDVRTGRSGVSLVQVAPPGGEVIVADVLTTGIDPLRPILESPEVKMVAHNAHFDEAVLRAAGVQTFGLIDTLRMSRMALTLGSHSLSSVSEHLFGVPLDKSLQRSNWRRRPLTGSQIEYAALDAHVVLRVYDELSRILAEQGRLEVALRASAVEPKPAGEQSKPRRRRTAPVPEIILTPEEKRLVATLKKWRLERANSRRVPAYMICPDRTLEHIARARPTTLEALASIYGLGESKVRSFGEDLLKAIQEALS